ncbi:hypothetical protein G5B40_04350 [Pikeienuella piscinae]|uniref:Uncharacterized protein n=1 Tax=Pikeienuella piscinae TaxID=2748098 RepID=A0A7L5BYQ9_9RHOB|nr:hypothetical protein [Pikeienuella piscinae]QIE54739.1 hypothetical protein G5B40_04350 [Pikeienuella piscinae]
MTARGGAPVGRLEELPDIEAAAVLFLRFWRTGATTREPAKADFHASLGQAAGEQAAATTAALVDMIERHGRRPLVHHAPGCRHVGGDEAAFANLVAAAAAGQREDAILFATLIFRTDMAFVAAGLAARFGQFLMRMTARRRAVEIGFSAPRDRVLH